MEPSFNFELDGYKVEHTPTEASVGGSLLYISENLTYEPRTDLNSLLYCPSLIESTFVEISMPNSPNIIVGSIYKHPLHLLMISTLTILNLFSLKSVGKISKSFSLVTLTLIFYRTLK